jgi:molecular chaperone Hsp33
VELQSGEIGDDIASYLVTSEQIPSVVAVGVLANPEGIKAAGGIIAQVLPGASEQTIEALERNALSMESVTSQIGAGADAEGLARSIAGNLEMRLTRAYDVRFTCSCSRERVERVLLGLGEDELRKMASELPQTEAVCEFCKTAFVFSREELVGLIERLEAHR